jgi:hypothetical protein
METQKNHDRAAFHKREMHHLQYTWCSKVNEENNARKMQKSKKELPCMTAGNKKQNKQSSGRQPKGSLVHYFREKLDSKKIEWDNSTIWGVATNMGFLILLINIIFMMWQKTMQNKK